MQKLPIEKLSFSAFRSYVTSPASFWRNYVLKQWDNTEHKSMLEGKAMHKALESYYLGASFEEALSEGLALFSEGAKDFTAEHWGKKGSLEKSLEDITLCINHCENEIGKRLPTRQEIAVINIENDLLHRVSGHEIPLKAKPDMLYLNVEHDLFIGRDWKKTATLSPMDEESGKPIVPAKYYYQAYFVGCVAEKEYDRPLDQFTFTEIRPVKKAETISVQNVTIQMGEGWRELPVFKAVAEQINLMIEDIKSPHRRYVANVFDMMDGDTEWTRLLNQHTYEGESSREEDPGAPEEDV